MTLTSCYRYVLELPVDTLNLMLRASLQHPENAGIGLPQITPNVPVDGHTATVDVRLAEQDTHPATLSLPPADLAAVLHLHMQVSVTLDDVPDLDAIVYMIDFDLAGQFARDTAGPLPRLLLSFTGVDAASLNLVVSGGQVVLTAALVEARIHALYQADPSLGHNVQTNVPWPPGPDPTVLVTTDIYDDDPMSPGFRGAITVTVQDPATLIIHMPGHFQIKGLGATPYVDSDMNVDVKVAVQSSDGELRIKLGSVHAADVTVTFATPPSNPIYAIASRTALSNGIASKISSMGPPPDHDIVQALPTSAEIRGTIADRLVAFAAGLGIPVFTPQPPQPGEIDLTTFDPATVDQKVLALQLVPLADGTLCDGVTAFAHDTGFAVAVAKPEVDTMLQPMLSGNLGDRNIDGHDITVNRLDGTLSDPGDHGQARGHIWIDGSAEVHVDCWPDPDIDFSGPIFLTPEMDTDGKVSFTADAGSFTATDPCCAHVDPATIPSLIAGKKSLPIALPSNFGQVGELHLGVTEAEIFAAGIVVHGTLDVISSSALHADALRKTLYWFSEPSGGG